MPPQPDCATAMVHSEIRVFSYNKCVSMEKTYGECFWRFQPKSSVLLSFQESIILPTSAVFPTLLVASCKCGFSSPLLKTFALQSTTFIFVDNTNNRLFFFRVEEKNISSSPRDSLDNYALVSVQLCAMLFPFMDDTPWDVQSFVYCFII